MSAYKKRSEMNVADQRCTSALSVAAALKSGQPASERAWAVRSTEPGKVTQRLQETEKKNRKKKQNWQWYTAVVGKHAGCQISSTRALYAVRGECLAS
jgi:hypothetical protein